MNINLGIFPNRESADSAIVALEEAGYDSKEISIVTRETTETAANNRGSNVGTGAASGATTGAVIGGLTGLLVGIGAIAIPGIGGLLIGGPLAAALGLTGIAATTISGTVTGALAGGIVGALVGLGVPEDTARDYEARIKTGAVLVAVPADAGGKRNESRSILEKHNADQIRTINVDKWQRLD